jgi:hypothetical protein
MERKGVIFPDNISCSEADGILSTYSRPIYVRFWTVILYKLFLFLINATYTAHEFLLDHMSLTVFGEEYKLCNFCQVCSCSDIFLLGPHNPLTTLCQICVRLRI